MNKLLSLITLLTINIAAADEYLIAECYDKEATDKNLSYEILEINDGPTSKYEVRLPNKKIIKISSFSRFKISNTLLLSDKLTNTNIIIKDGELTESLINGIEVQCEPNF